MIVNSLLRFILFSIFSATVLAAPTPRWYSDKQVTEGTVIFKQNCSACHGDQAQSTPNWKDTNTAGQYPPPPLNGSAHAWHHSLDVLRTSVKDGGQKIGGLMPSFEKTLTPSQRDSAIAFFQSQWSDKLYTKWSGRFQVAAPKTKNTMSNDEEMNPIFNQLKQRLGITNMNKATSTANQQLYQVSVNGRIFYVTKDGQYALIGNLIDLKTGQNLTPKP